MTWKLIQVHARVEGLELGMRQNWKWFLLIQRICDSGLKILQKNSSTVTVKTHC